MPALDLSPLEDALKQLKQGLKEAMENPASDIIRDGVIQRFEYSHELALKFIRRILETRHADKVDQMSYNELLRTAAERGYIENVEEWMEYRKARNQTSHTYDGTVAVLVFKSAAPFLKNATIFFKHLEKVNS
ncbi:MAG: nucleotidyltransferase substrate binding protein [Candidatus Peribacteraceae bacterium]|nr:nucleotidyltransferase substrate binding protein [Candidatus Peribacteraceae bacterium]